MAAKSNNENQTARFPVLHPQSIPTGLRGGVTKQARRVAADRANTRKVLAAVMDAHGSSELPTAAQVAASKGKKNPTQPPSLAEYQQRKYGRGK